MFGIVHTWESCEAPRTQHNPSRSALGADPSGLSTDTLCHAQTGALEYTKEDSMTTMDRFKRFLQKKDGAAPATPPKPPQAHTPKQKRLRA